MEANEQSDLILKDYFRYQVRKGVIKEKDVSLVDFHTHTTSSATDPFGRLHLPVGLDGFFNDIRNNGLERVCITDVEQFPDLSQVPYDLQGKILPGIELPGQVELGEGVDSERVALAQHILYIHILGLFPIGFKPSVELNRYIDVLRKQRKLRNDEYLRRIIGNLQSNTEFDIDTAIKDLYYKMFDVRHSDGAHPPEFLQALFQECMHKLGKRGPIGKAHIITLLLDMLNNPDYYKESKRRSLVTHVPLLKPGEWNYRSVFYAFFGPKKAALLGEYPRNSVSIDILIPAIYESRGVAVWAHPLLTQPISEEIIRATLDALIRASGDQKKRLCVEANYAYKYPTLYPEGPDKPPVKEPVWTKSRQLASVPDKKVVSLINYLNTLVDQHQLTKTAGRDTATTFSANNHVQGMLLPTVHLARLYNLLGIQR